MSEKKEVIQLYVTRNKSSKSEGKTYLAICVDLPHRTVQLSYDKLLMCELLDCRVSELEAIEVGEKRYA